MQDECEVIVIHQMCFRIKGFLLQLKIISKVMATLCDPSDQHPWVYDMYEAYQMHNNFTKGNIAKITFFTEHGDLPRMVSRIDARRTHTKGTDMMVKVS